MTGSAGDRQRVLAPERNLIQGIVLREAERQDVVRRIDPVDAAPGQGSQLADRQRRDRRPTVGERHLVGSGELNRPQRDVLGDAQRECVVQGIHPIESAPRQGRDLTS